jgi:hypothetical protein
MTSTRNRFTLPRYFKSLIMVAFLMVCLAANNPMARPNRNSAKPLTSPNRNSAKSWEVDGLSPHVLQLALQAVESATAQGIGKRKIVGIIDYSLPSTKRRFWVLNLEQKRVVFHELVAHGKGSGENLATSFSNQSGSFQSSLGLYLTESPYEGEHGYSLRLRGLEEKVNDQAKSRAIVLHGAWYVNQSMIDRQKRLGRSLGCPAVEDSVAKPLIDSLKEGHLIFVYYPDPQWLSTSRFLHPINP